MKAFFDVFPSLEVKADLREYFAETQIERLTTNKDRTRIKIVLHSDHLIHKDRIYRMQEELSRQVFAERTREIYIDEHYSLSAQYTPRRLMEEYHDSLVSEVGSFSHVMGLYFREAGVDYMENGAIVITLEDTCLSRKLAFSLEEALNRIFRERCGVPAELKVELKARGKKTALVTKKRTRKMTRPKRLRRLRNPRKLQQSRLPMMMKRLRKQDLRCLMLLQRQVIGKRRCSRTSSSKADGLSLTI